MVARYFISNPASSSSAAFEAYLFDSVDHPLRLSSVQVTCTGGGSQCNAVATNSFYEVDLAGNVRRLRDSTGADLGGYRYTAFGVTFPADGETPAAQVNQPLRWKGRPFENVAGGGIYDVRARWWSPGMGAFLSIDEYAYHDTNSTLWGWPSANPNLWADPEGHDGTLIAVYGGGGGSSAAGGTGLVLADVLPPVVILAASTLAVLVGEAAIDAHFQSAQAAEQAQFAADINAFNQALAAGIAYTMAEHSKNARPSTQEKHEQGETRQKRDKPGGEKGDGRRPYRRGNGKKKKGC